MKRVKILTSMAGDGFAWQLNDEVELPAEEAQRLIAAGYAVEAEKPKKKKAGAISAEWWPTEGEA